MWAPRHIYMRRRFCRRLVYQFFPIFFFQFGNPFRLRYALAILPWLCKCSLYTLVCSKRSSAVSCRIIAWLLSFCLLRTEPFRSPKVRWLISVVGDDILPEVVCVVCLEKAESLTEDIDTLYKIVHTSSYSVSLQTLKLLFQVHQIR